MAARSVLLRAAVPLLALALLAGCGIHVPDGVTRHIDAAASHESFTYCYGHGCGDSATVRLTESQWAQIAALFAEQAADPAEERRRIALAVAALETMAGAQAGTGGDLGGTGGGWFRRGQLDCYDEAINTSNFVAMMQNDGLLHFHRLSNPLQHGIVAGWSWPHATAVIAEIAGPSTGLERSVRYAVDSWFHDNGVPPEVVAATAWKAGWQPTLAHGR
ncbi:MAG: hypothetical protein R3F55_10200 [Alphaproteobacteria bacterium]